MRKQIIIEFESRPETRAIENLVLGQAAALSSTLPGSDFDVREV